MSDFITKIKSLILFIGDIAVFYLALYLTLIVRYSHLEISARWEQHFLPFTFIFIVWWFIFYIYGLYNLNIAKNNTFFYSTLFKALTICALVAVVFFYFIKPGIAPKTNLLIQLIFLVALLIIWRQIFNQIGKIKSLQQNLLIIGLNEITVALANEIKNKPQLGFNLVGILDEEEKHVPDLKDVEGIEILSSPYSLEGLVKIKNIKVVVMALDFSKNANLVNGLYKCLPLKISFWDLPSFIEKFLGKIPVNSIGQIWFLENLKESQKKLYEKGKRVFDILISIFLLLVSLPFLPLLYLLVKTGSKGSFFFMQQRTGLRGKKFMAVKIRTMYQDAEKSGPQWAQKNDPRVTRIGKFFRKARIDEIPQLLNILRGEMSFIGPRPERPEFVEKLEKKIPFYNERLLVKPGLTGWAQINFPYGASEEDAMEKLQYDLFYIKNRSFMLDLSILLKTIKTVLSGGGQ